MTRRVLSGAAVFLGSALVVLALGIVYFWRAEILAAPGAVWEWLVALYGSTALWFRVVIGWPLLAIAVGLVLGAAIRRRDRPQNYGPYEVNGTPEAHAAFRVWAGQVRPGDRIREELTGDVLEWTGHGWINHGPAL